MVISRQIVILYTSRRRQTGRHPPSGRTAHDQHNAMRSQKKTICEPHSTYNLWPINYYTASERQRHSPPLRRTVSSARSTWRQFNDSRLCIASHEISSEISKVFHSTTKMAILSTRICYCPSGSPRLSRNKRTAGYNIVKINTLDYINYKNGNNEMNFHCAMKVLPRVVWPIKLDSCLRAIHVAACDSTTFYVPSSNACIPRG